MKHLIIHILQISILIIAGFHISIPALMATKKYVKITMQGDGSGDAWSNASNDLQAMIDLEPDTIWVAEGVYSLPNESIDFGFENSRFEISASKVIIFGGLAGNEPNDFDLASRDLTTHVTKLDGAGGRVGILGIEDQSHGTIIDGFTFCNGLAAGGNTGNSYRWGGAIFIGSNGSQIRNCIFEINQASVAGGAIYITSSLTTIVDCAFSQNNSIAGGAIHNFSGAEVDIERCIFIDNISSKGSAISNYCEIDDCQITVDSSLMMGSFYNESAGGKAVFELKRSALVNASAINRTTDLGADSATTKFTDSKVYSNVGDPAFLKNNGPGYTSFKYGNNCQFYVGDLQISSISEVLAMSEVSIVNELNNYFDIVSSYLSADELLKYNITENVVDKSGNVYEILQIGNQRWLSTNLRTSHYSDGTPISNLEDEMDWQQDVNGAYCWYNNDDTHDPDFGKLYNWYAVNKPLGLCPTNWHVASGDDWDALIAYVGSEAGKKLKEAGTTHWNTPNSGVNSVDFTALPGGFRSPQATFNLKGQIGSWWTSTDQTQYLMLSNSDDVTASPNAFRAHGYSVRCVRD